MKPARLTALGELIGIHPDFHTGDAPWYCVGYDRRGNWKSLSILPTEEAARKARSATFALHRKLARERAARKR